VSEDTILNEFPGRAFLFAASGEDGPDALRPLASPFGAGALSDFAVNDDGPKGLLGQVVGGSNRRVDQESQVRAPVFVQPVGDILRFPWQLFFRNKGSQVSLNDEDSPSILFLRHGVAQMPEIKQALELAQKPNPKLLIGGVRKRGQEFDVANQMSQAELLKGAGIFDIGREEIADERAFESFAQHFLQDLRVSGDFDGKKTEEFGAEGPYPIAIAVVFVTCFIDMKTGLAGQDALKLLIRDFERRADGFDLIGESGAGDLELEDLGHEFLEGGVGAVKGGFHINDQTLEPGAEDLAFNALR